MTHASKENNVPLHDLHSVHQSIEGAGVAHLEHHVTAFDVVALKLEPWIVRVDAIETFGGQRQTVRVVGVGDQLVAACKWAIHTEVRKICEPDGCIFRVRIFDTVDLKKKE